MTERRDEPVTGDVIESGDVRMRSWEWSEVPGAPARSRLPWFGIFLVVFGGLLLLRQLFPSLETAGSLLFLAIGVAFLVSWLINRGMGSLYLGAIITAPPKYFAFATAAMPVFITVSKPVSVTIRTGCGLCVAEAISVPHMKAKGPPNIFCQVALLTARTTSPERPKLAILLK